MDEQGNMANTSSGERLDDLSGSGIFTEEGEQESQLDKQNNLTDQQHGNTNKSHRVFKEDTDDPESSDLDESNGFQKVGMQEERRKIDTVDVETIDGVFESDERDNNTQTYTSGVEENIDFPDMETDEPQIEENITEMEISDQETKDMAKVLPGLASTQATSNVGCLLRHRIDPEPPRQLQDEDDEFVRLSHEDITPKGSKERRKIAFIRKALESDPVDIASLRNLAISPGGLVNKDMRQRVWPLLISVNTNNITPKPSQEEMQSMTQTYSQVVMDVNRSSSRFPPGIDDHVRMSMKDKLVDLIMRVMLKHRQLKYYQGFHDVCITFLLCMDEDLAFAMVDKLAMGYMREYLDETMERTSLLLNFVYPLVKKCNPELCEHMERNDLGTIFALSWVITWFSHVLGDIRRILRVFDFFLASHRMMPVYLSAAFVLYREQDIYAAGDEMGYIHKCLSTIPTDLPLEDLLERAGDLYLQYPPTEISRDPMLIRMNRQVYEHFNRVDSHSSGGCGSSSVVSQLYGQ